MKLLTFTPATLRRSLCDRTEVGQHLFVLPSIIQGRNEGRDKGNKFPQSLYNINKPLTTVLENIVFCV